MMSELTKSDMSLLLDRIETGGLRKTDPRIVLECINYICDSALTKSWLVGSFAHCLYKSSIKNFTSTMSYNDYDVHVHDNPTNSMFHSSYEEIGEYMTDRKAFGIERIDTAYCCGYGPSSGPCKNRAVVCVIVYHKTFRSQFVLDIFYTPEITEYLQEVPLAHDGIAIKLPVNVDKMQTLCTGEYAKCVTGDNKIITSRDTRVFNKATYSDKLRGKGFSELEIAEWEDHNLIRDEITF